MTTPSSTPMRARSKASGRSCLAPGTQGRVPNVGHGVLRDGVREPEWVVVENSSGTVTVMPSIDEGDGGYHGFLTDGIWSDG